MKKLILILFATVQFSWALSGVHAELISGFTNLLNQDMQASDGDVTRLDCGPNAQAEGIVCAATIKLIATVSNGASQGGGEEVCDEAYTYSGGASYNTICSTCEYSKNYDYHQKTCAIEQATPAPAIPKGLISALNASVYWGYIMSYETPIYKGDFKDNSDDTIEVYELNFTEVVYGDGSYQYEGQDIDEITKLIQVCEYITYNPSLKDYSLTQVSCENPWTDVIDEELIDEL